MKRSAVLISIILTLFVLGVGAGVGKAIFNNQSDTSQVASMQATLDSMQALYAQTVADANQRIEQANTTLANIQYTGAAPVSASLNTDLITNLALAAAGEGAQVASTPQLVEYGGIPAYEVLLVDGNILYFDAASGNLLFNSLTGTSDAVITYGQASQAALAYLGGGRVYLIERSTLNGAPVYRIQMATGSQVYVDLRGQVVYVQLIQAQAPQVSAQPDAGQPAADDDGDDDD